MQLLGVWLSFFPSLSLASSLILHISPKLIFSYDQYFIRFINLNERTLELSNICFSLFPWIFRQEFLACYWKIVIIFLVFYFWQLNVLTQEKGDLSLFISFLSHELGPGVSLLNITRVFILNLEMKGYQKKLKSRLWFQSQKIY